MTQIFSFVAVHDENCVDASLYASTTYRLLRLNDLCPICVQFVSGVLIVSGVDFTTKIFVVAFRQCWPSEPT